MHLAQIPVRDFRQNGIITALFDKKGFKKVHICNIILNEAEKVMCLRAKPNLNEQAFSFFRLGTNRNFF